MLGDRVGGVGGYTDDIDAEPLGRFEVDVVEPGAPQCDAACSGGRELLEDVGRFVVSFYDGSRWTSFWPPSTQLNALQPTGLRIELDVGPWPDIEMNVLLPELVQ